MDFREFIRELAHGARCLEIGPSYRPIIPKSAGYDVMVFDHASADELREKYAAFGVDTSLVEDVDRIGTDIGRLLDEPGRFDLIVASHLVEHTTDFIGFINHCEQLLTPDGVVALIVPDKRFGFDLFRPLTTAGAIIDAHISGRSRHLGGLFDHYANFTTSSGNMAWGEGDTGQIRHIHGPADATRELEKALATGDYVDAHEWIFTPSSFQLVIHDLLVSGQIHLRTKAFYPSEGYEFLAVLDRHAGAPDALDRTALQHAVAAEELVALLAILARSPATGEPDRTTGVPLTTRELRQLLAIARGEKEPSTLRRRLAALLSA
jgi:SAM-dependent methyltransferase